jgi:hypothetical protein
VPYVPDWEPLANALKRVFATGSKEQEAKADICNAVADKRIAVRILVDESDRDVGGKTLLAPHVGVPPRLNPEDFDWVRSRPLTPWETGPTSVLEGYFPTWSWKPRNIALIELSTADVASVLCGGAADHFDRAFASDFPTETATRATQSDGSSQMSLDPPDAPNAAQPDGDAVASPPEGAKGADKNAAVSPLLPPSGASSPQGGARRRGPKPTARETTAAKMRSDIDASCITKEQLGGMLEKTLAERYDVSRDTARKARNDVLAGS